MRRRVVMLGGAVMVVAACAGSGSGSGSGGGGPVDPVALVGETEQGLRMRLEPVGGRRIDLRFPASCGNGGGADVSVDRYRFETEVAADGGFAVDESYVEDGTDGDEEHVEVRIEGDFADDGTASGTLDASSRWWNGQAQSFGSVCETGTVAWTADRPPVEGDNLVVPTGPAAMAPAGPDLLVRSDAGEVVRLDAATGEGRRLDGSAADAPAPVPADPAVPSTEVAGVGGGAGTAADPAVAPDWLDNMAVVADGVWVVDPATGVVSRFELTGGAPTATIVEPLDRMAAGPDALWTVSTNAFRTGYSLDRRDPVTGEVVARTRVERGVITVGPTDVWYADATLAGGRLGRVDPATAVVGEPFDIDLPLFGEDIVTTDDRVWWTDLERLRSIELGSGRAGPVELPSPIASVAGDATGVWTVHEHEAVARRIEDGQVVRTVDLPEGWWRPVVTADGAVWLGGRGPEGDEPRVVRLDPAVTAG